MCFKRIYSFDNNSRDIKTLDCIDVTTLDYIDVTKLDCIDVTALECIDVTTLDADHCLMSLALVTGILTVALDILTKLAKNCGYKLYCDYKL